MTVSIWSSSERAAWAWPERQRPSEWVESNVVIPDNGFNAEPGPFSFDRTPYWREPIDTLADSTVREAWVYKANQVGFTQLMMAAAAYCAAQDPGALALLMPDEDSVEELFREQLKPLIDATPATKRLRTGRAWDSTAHELWLSTMPILGIYSGSASKLEKRPLRYVIADEINLLKDLPGEASAIQRALKRITTWQHRGKALFGSKPTTTDGEITKGYESCPDKRRYLMPCSRCNRYHEWQWSQVKGFKDAPGADKFERANWVKLNKAAHYECPLCKGRVEESERLSCVRHGRWVSGRIVNDRWTAVQSVTEDGNVVGDRIEADRVGFYVWSIVSPWVPLYLLAAEFIEAAEDPNKTRGFRNARLALPYHEVVKATAPSIVRDKKTLAGPPNVVPRWATGLFTTVDVQQDWVRFVIRAWGGGLKSQGVAEGFIYEMNSPVPAEQRKAWVWEELIRIGLDMAFPVDGGGVAKPEAMLIDSGDGGRTNEVYAFAARRPNILPTKGMSKSGARLYYESTPKPDVRLWMIDTSQYKSSLYSLIHDPDRTLWLPPHNAGEQYIGEMASESLMKEKGVWRWMPNGTARNEGWDCEVLQRAAADMFNVALRPTFDQRDSEPETTANQTSNPVTAYRGRW